MRRTQGQPYHHAGSTVCYIVTVLELVGGAPGGRYRAYEAKKKVSDLGIDTLALRFCQSASVYSAVLWHISDEPVPSSSPTHPTQPVCRTIRASVHDTEQAAGSAARQRAQQLLAALRHRCVPPSHYCCSRAQAQWITCRATPGLRPGQKQ